MKGEYKALHGFKGTIFLHGHMHSSPAIVDELSKLTLTDWKEDEKEKAKKELDDILHTRLIEAWNIWYHQDIRMIENLLSKEKIESICLELRNEQVVDVNTWHLRDKLNKNLKGLWYDQKTIDAIELYGWWPVFYLFFRWKLDGVQVIWIEGEEKEKIWRELSSMLEGFKYIRTELYKYTNERVDKAFIDSLIEYLSWVVIFSKEKKEKFIKNDLLKELPITDSMKHRIYDFIEKSFMLLHEWAIDRRNLEMSIAVDKNDTKKKLIIVWDAHVLWLKELLKGYHVKTSGSLPKDHITKRK